MECDTNINYLQPTGFRMLIDRRRFSNVSFFVRSVDHSSITTNEAPAPFRKYTSIPQLPDTYTYSALDVTLIMDEDMKSYIELLNWMKQNVDENPKSFEDEEPSRADLVLTILSSKNNLNKTITYQDAFPTSIGGITMEASADGGDVITYTASFAFSKFEIT